MNPYALCRWMGSELPGGYSTVIIRPSLPGRLVRSFDMSCVTSASCATSAPDKRHATSKICFVNFIDYLSSTHAISMHGVYWSVLRGVTHEFLFLTQPVFDVVSALPPRDSHKLKTSGIRGGRYQLALLRRSFSFATPVG